MANQYSHEARELAAFALNSDHPATLGPRKYLAASYRNVRKHIAGPRFDKIAALRLLANNGRDFAQAYLAAHCARGERLDDIFPVSVRQEFALIMLDNLKHGAHG